MIEIDYSDFKELSKSPLRINKIKIENFYANYYLLIGRHCSNPTTQFKIDILYTSVYINDSIISIDFTNHLKEARLVDKTNIWISDNRQNFWERTDQ